MILQEGSRTEAYNLIKVLLKEKRIALNYDYIVTYLKSGVNIGLQKFYAVFLL